MKITRIYTFESDDEDALQRQLEACLPDGRHMLPRPRGVAPVIVAVTTTGPALGWTPGSRCLANAIANPRELQRAREALHGAEPGVLGYPDGGDVGFTVAPGDAVYDNMRRGSCGEGPI